MASFHGQSMKYRMYVGDAKWQKLKPCPEQYLPIVESAIDGALKIEKPNEETEGV